MKKLVLITIIALLAAVPVFATPKGDDSVVISLTITPGTSITSNIENVTLTTTSTGNTVSAGTIILGSNIDATWYFVLESQNAVPSKGLLVNADGDTFAYTVSLGSILETSPLALTTNREGTISVTAGNSTTATLKIHYGATSLLNAGTYTDTVKVYFYDSDPTP